MPKYYLEFTLNTYNASVETIKNSLREFGENLEVFVAEKGDIDKTCNYKVQVHTEDPTIIFDICSQFGRIKSVKIDEDISYGDRY